MEQLEEKSPELPILTDDTEAEDENEEIFKWLSIAVLLIWIISFFLF